MTQHSIQFHYAGSLHTIESKDDQPLLESLRNAGIPVRRACRNGACGVCLCKVTSGKISYRGREPTGLWEHEQQAGFILPCTAYACSDLVLDQLPLEPSKQR